MLRESEVDQLDMASVDFGKHDVLGLQIPVNDSMPVQELEGQNDLAGVEVDVVLELFVVLADLTEHGAALDVLQLEVQVVFVLERAVDAHDERALVVHFRKVLEHLAFRDDVVHLLHLGHVLLLQTFQCAQPLGLLVEGADDFAKVSHADNFMQLKLTDFGFVGLFDPHLTGPLGRLIVKLRIVELILELTGLILLLYDGLGLPQSAHLHVILSVLLVVYPQLLLLLFQGVFPRVSHSRRACLQRSTLVVDLAADSRERHSLQELPAARGRSTMQLLVRRHHSGELLVDFEVVHRGLLGTLTATEIS